jgi:nucleotide-binding universal stress UspA family protein
MKSILLPVFADDGFDSRFQAALAVARRLEGHLTCLQTYPDAAVIVGDFAAPAVYYGDLIQQVRATQAEQRAKVEAHLAKEDVAWDWIQFGTDAAQALASRARLADLVVLSSTAGSSLPAGAAPADVALRSPAPCLVVPQGANPPDLAAPALVGWNGSAEAATALRGALPLLKIAQSVVIAEIGEPNSDYPATMAATYLSRHGVHAAIQSHRADDGIAETLIASARGIGAQLIVMGAYGRTRLREAVFGGVSRDMFAHSPVALLTAH